MLLTFVSFLISILGSYENIDDLIGVKGPLVFNKTEFQLSLSGQPEKNLTLHVYLPKGEDLDTYNQKVSLIVLDTKKDVDGVIKAKIKDLVARQKTDFNCTYSAIDLVEGKEMLVEYIQTEMNGKKLSEAEFHISRVKWLTDHNNGSYMLIYTYSWRTYDEEATDMIKNIQTYKTEFIQELSKKEMPEVRLPK
jgi:hypothetical protein